jgi:hypothetical protein
MYSRSELFARAAKFLFSIHLPPNSDELRVVSDDTFTSDQLAVNTKVKPATNHTGQI